MLIPVHLICILPALRARLGASYTIFSNTKYAVMCLRRKLNMAFAAFIFFLSTTAAFSVTVVESPATGLLLNEPAGLLRSEDFFASVRLGGGLLNGVAYERVYFNFPERRHKLSELIWEMKNVFMLGCEGAIGFYDLLQLNCSAWLPVSKGAGGMDDYDWMTLRTSEWSHWSSSEVDVDRSLFLDINVSIQLFAIEHFTLNGVLGYSRLDWKWSDSGGAYIYSSNPDSLDGFRDVHGDFRGVNGIIYRQTYDIPYIGVGAGFAHAGFAADVYVRYSPLAQATDEDDHLLRKITFEGRYRNAEYLGLIIGVSYTFDSGLFLRASFDYQNVFETNGDIALKQENVYSDTAKSAGSIEVNATQASLALGCSF